MRILLARPMDYNLGGPGRPMTTVAITLYKSIKIKYLSSRQPKGPMPFGSKPGQP
jgi:hypothetical protein